MILMSEEVKKLVKTSITLTKDLWEQAKIIALKQGLTLTEVIQAALKKYLEILEKERKGT
ncbi:MAG: hypothetical protein QXQ28_06935 [Candidatus Nezhaarchaeales archaeon]